LSTIEITAKAVLFLLVVVPLVSLLVLLVPGDKPAGTQWYHWRQVASVNSRKVYYAIDTAGGQSGSAVYRIISGGHYGIAIHAYGGATANSGTRIVQPVFNNLVAWKA
jgi:glutamyl endopeptidase